MYLKSLTSNIDATEPLKAEQNIQEKVKEMANFLID